MVPAEQRIEPQPTWPHDPEPDRITNMTGGFFDGAAKAHSVPKELRGRIVDAERRVDGWYWIQRKDRTEERMAELEQENKSLRKLLSIATAFHVKAGEHAYHPVTLERCDRPNLPPWWAVRQRGFCLAKSGQWEYEPMPSHRDDAFYARCRWTDFAEALQAAQECTP